MFDHDVCVCAVMLQWPAVALFEALLSVSCQPQLLLMLKVIARHISKSICCVKAELTYAIGTSRLHDLVPSIPCSTCKDV